MTETSVGPGEKCDLPVAQSIPACPGCPARGGHVLPRGAVLGHRHDCTHGHSQAGFRSRSGWGGRSWWWSPEAGNLFDSGRALCSQPVARIKGPMVTFHLAMLHTCHLISTFP